MKSDEGVPTTRHYVDYGTLAGGYRQLHAMVFQFLLQDIPPQLTGTAALVSPAATTPFPFLLSRLTCHRPLYLADPSHQDLEMQRALVQDDQAFYLHGGVSELPDSLTDLGIVLNPFGLQHWHAEAPRFASAVRKHSRDDGRLYTLDWGVTRYPDDFAGLPGIAEEIHFSRSALLCPYGPESGWRLLGEREIAFGLQHSVEEIATLLSGEHAELLRAAAQRRQSPIIVIGSSVLYRQYEPL